MTTTISTSDYTPNFPLPEGSADFRDPMFNLVPTRCKTVVEIGTFVGRWAVRCLKQIPNCTLYCVDPFPIKRQKPTADGRMANGDDFFTDWIFHTREFGPRAVPLRGKSWDIAPKFEEEIDFLFIDGEHSRKAVLRDLRDWVPKVRKGGLIVGHDWQMKSVRRAVGIYWPDKELFNVTNIYYSATARVLTPCFWRYK